MPDDYGYDLTGTAFSTDPGVHNDKPAGRYVTAAERMQATYERATARLREQERVLEQQYGEGILDAVDDWRHEIEEERESRI